MISIKSLQKTSIYGAIKYIPLIIIFSAPLILFEYTSILHIYTPNSFNYILRESYSISIVFILLFAISLFIVVIKGKIQSSALVVVFCIFLIVFYDFIIRYIQNGVFSFELYFLLFEFFILTIYTFLLFKDLRKLISVISVIHLVTLIISFILQHTEMVGRYSSFNANFGLTGYILAIESIIIAVEINKNFVKKSIFLSILLIGIFLTGSRINLFLTMFFVFLAVMFAQRFSFKKLILPLIILLLIPVAYYFFQSYSESSNMIVDSIIRVINSPIEFLKNDESLMGRVDSFSIGIKVLIRNPMGVGFSSFEVQRNMNMLGYPTFPHSTLLTFIVMFGLVLLIPIICFIAIYLKRSFRSKYITVFLFFITYNVFFGGLFLNFKFYYFSLIVLIFIYNERKTIS